MAIKAKKTKEAASKAQARVIKALRHEEHLLFVSLIVALVAIVVINTAYLINNAQNNTGSTATSSQSVQVKIPQKIAKSNETISNDTFAVSVTSVGENDTYDPAFAVPDTETILTLTLSITNKTGAPQHFIPSQYLYVRSLYGDYATMHPSSYITDPISSDDIKSGKTVTGQVSFSIPKSQSRPLLYVDTGWNDYAPAVFDVLH